MRPHVLVVTDGGRIDPGSLLVGPDGTQGVTVIDLPARWDDLDDPNNLRIAFTSTGAEVITMHTAPRMITPPTR